ncbi:MAG: hypothetical protein ACI87E_002415 [Mariniblastus sp.]|jgi:hypothetical protein
MSKRKSNGFNFERLEDRRLLAADFGAELFQAGALPVEPCLVASVEVESQYECCCMFDGESNEIELESDPQIENDLEVSAEDLVADAAGTAVETESELDVESELDDPLGSESEIPPVISVDGELGELGLEKEPLECGLNMAQQPLEPEVDSEVALGDPIDVEIVGVSDPVGDEVVDGECQPGVVDEALVDGSEVSTELLSNRLRDPVLGTSGYFGMIDLETPVTTVTFAASEAGTVDAVIASSFGDSETRIEIVDGEGDLVVSSMTEDMEGFQKLTFDVERDQEYAITISSDEFGEGYFMLTVDFAVTDAGGVLGPFDLLADQISDEASLLTVEDDRFKIEAELETPEDCDASGFVAPTDGEVSLAISTVSEGFAADASVAVFNDNGEELVTGMTNEEVSIRFDANSGVECQIIVDSTNDIPATFDLRGTLFADSIEDPAWDSELDLAIQPTLSTEPASEVDIVFDNGVDQLLDEGLEVFEASDDVTEGQLVDDVFQRFGEGIEAENQPRMSRGFDIGQRGWFNRI